jgi:hypothetical protein
MLDFEGLLLENEGIQLELIIKLYFPLTERAAKGAMGPKHGKLVFAKNKNHEVSPLPPSIIP